MFQYPSQQSLFPSHPSTSAIHPLTLQHLQRLQTQALVQAQLQTSTPTQRRPQASSKAQAAAPTPRSSASPSQQPRGGDRSFQALVNPDKEKTNNEKKQPRADDATAARAGVKEGETGSGVMHIVPKPSLAMVMGVVANKTGEGNEDDQQAVNLCDWVMTSNLPRNLPSA